MKIRNIFVLLVCAFLFISSVSAFAETCSPTLLGQAGREPYPTCVVASGNYAYMTIEGGLVVFDVSDSQNPVLIGRYPIVDSATELCIVGSTLYMASWEHGLYILDVSNPASPVLLGQFYEWRYFNWDPMGYLKPGAGLYVLGTTAYMAAGTGGLYIIDVSNPAAPGLLGIYNTAPGFAGGVYVAGNTAYVTVHAHYGVAPLTGLLVIDVSNPAAPVLIGSYNTPGHANKVQVSGTTAYVTEFGAWDGLRIIDISDPASPLLLGSFYTAGHANGIYVSGKTAYVANGGGMIIIDVSNPALPTLHCIYSDSFTGAAMHVYVSGGIAYVPGFGEKGPLRLIDVSCCIVNESDSPITVVSISPEPNAGDWNNTDVTINLTATDNEGGSGIKELHYELTGTVNEERTILDSTIEIPVHTEGITTLTYYAIDNSGNIEVAKTQKIKIDKTSPVIVSQVSPQPNSNGWNNTDVTVDFTATDALSGIVSVSDPFTVTTEGGGQLIGGEATDAAGNSAATFVALNIDKTPPTITAQSSPQPNANGWNNTDVTVSFAADDSLSGIAIVTDPVAVTTEGEGQQISGEAVDLAGNSAAASVVLNIDKTQPAASITATPGVLWPPNHKLADVIINGSAGDILSGIASKTFRVIDEYATVEPIITDFNSIIQLEAWREGKDKDGRNYTITVTAQDQAGNEYSASTAVICPHDSGKKKK